MTTTLFDFLKNFNSEAYEIALQIEDEVTTSPASIKTYATTFLECIVDDMLLKSGNMKNIKPMTNFTPKVKKLSYFGVIKYSFETQLINAYKLRNTAHYSLKKTAEEDKRLALELYEKLFHIAWRYFQEFGGNEYNYLGKPKFIPPFRENEEKELVEVPNIERMEKIFDHCIICGRKNNSHYHNLCNDCNNKIEHVEDIINMKNHFDGKFTKRNIVDLGYSKPYSDALVRELLNENLILKVDKSYVFNDEYFKSYLEEIEMYGELERVLSEFASGKLSLKDIKKSDYYLKGMESVKPYTQLYKIVSDTIFKEFISQLSLGIEISEIMEDTTITQEEIISWYNNQLNLLERGIKNNDFINYNKISIDSFIKLRACGKTHDEIIDELHLPSDIVEFWQTTYLKELDYFKSSLDDVNIDLILKAISENKTKTDFLDNLEITQEELDCLLDKYSDFSKIYTRDYVIKRRNDFLYYLNENNFATSIEKAYLSRKEVDEWLNIGRKDFELRHPGELCEFYRNTIEKLMKHYIRYRINAVSKGEAARKINQSPKTIDQWLRRDDYEIFINFQKECENITMSVLINAIKKGLTLKQAAALADMSQNNLLKLIRQGENGDEQYLELYEVYQNKYIPTQLNSFLDKIQSSKYKKALKSAHLTEDELNKFYIMGLEGNDTFKEFSDKYFEFKLQNYIKEIVQKGKTPQRASRNVNFIEEDFKYHQNDIDDAIVNKQLKIILPMVRESIPAEIISNKINIDVEVLFDWYVRGYEGDERFKEFSECYWENRMESSIKNFQSLFNKGMSETFFLKHVVKNNVKSEYKFWKKLDVFKYSNKTLTEEEQFNIYKEEILDVVEAIDKKFEVIEDESDEESIDDILDEIEDVDLKEHFKEFIVNEEGKNG